MEHNDFLLNSKPIRNEISKLKEIYKKFSKEGLVDETETFVDDGLNVVRSSAISMRSLLEGIYRCCNFLRTYYPNKKAFILEDSTEQILEIIDIVSPKFHVLKQTRNAIKRHKEGKEDELFGSFGNPVIPISLRDIHKNNRLNLLSPKELKPFLEDTLIRHLSSEEFSIIENHLPEEWIAALNYEPDNESA